MKKILAIILCLLTVANFGLFSVVNAADTSVAQATGNEMYSTNARHMTIKYAIGGGGRADQSSNGTTVLIDENADGLYETSDVAFRYVLTGAGKTGDPVFMNYGLPVNGTDNGGNNPGTQYLSFAGYAGTNPNAGTYWDMPNIVKDKTYQFVVRAKAPEYTIDSKMEADNVLYVDKSSGSVKVKSDMKNGMIGAPLGFRINTNRTTPNTYAMGTFTGYLDESGKYIPFTFANAKYTQAVLMPEYVDYVGYFTATGQTKGETASISQDTIIFADNDDEGLWYIDEISISDAIYTSEISGVEMYATKAHHMGIKYAIGGGGGTSNSANGTTVLIDENNDDVYEVSDSVFRYTLTEAGKTGDHVFMNYGIPVKGTDNGGNTPGTHYLSFAGYAGTNPNAGTYWDMPNMVKDKKYHFIIRAKAPEYVTDSSMENENILYVNKSSGEVKVKTPMSNGMIGAPLGFRINTNSKTPNKFSIGTFTGYIDDNGKYVDFTDANAEYTEALLTSEYVDYVGYFVSAGQTKGKTDSINQSTIVSVDNSGEGLWYIDELSIIDTSYTIGSSLEELSALMYSDKSEDVTVNETTGRITIPADNNVSYTIDVERAGYYKVLMYGKYVGSVPAITVTGSEKEVIKGGGITRSGDETPTDRRYTICRVYLKKGINTLNFSFANGGADIQSIFLKCVDHSISSVGENIIEAHDYYTSNIKTIWDEDFQYNYRNDYQVPNSEHSMRGPVIVSAGGLGRICKYRINVEESGEYKLRAYAAGETSRTIYGEFYVSQNKKELASGKIRLDKVHPETNVGTDLTTFNLSAGLQEIDITAHVSNPSMYIYYYTLEQVADAQSVSAISKDVKNELQAESVFHTDTGVTKGSESATISEGNTANFYLNVAESGKYAFLVKYKSDGGELLVKNENDVLYKKATVPTNDSFVVQILFVSDMKSGVNKISMSAKSNIEIDSVSLQSISDESSLAAINSASSEDELVRAIESFETSLSIELTEAMDGIFYKTPVYNRLLKDDFATLEDFINEYNIAVLSEYKQPWATLKINGVKTTKLASGKITINAATGYAPEGSTMIVALYEKVGSAIKMYKHDMCDEISQNTYEFDLGNTTIDEKKDYVIKFFYWDGLENLKPIEVFNSVYKVIYVETDGNDATADGSQEHPYKTIVAAMDKVAEINKYQWGDIVVNVGSGVHTLTDTLYINETHSGKNGFDVIVRGGNDIQPTIISGGIEVTNWQEHKNGIWKAPLSGVEYARNLYVNGYPAVMARSESCYDSAVLYRDSDPTWDKDGLTMKIADVGTTFARPQDLGLVFPYTFQTFIASVNSAITTDTEITFLVEPEIFNMSTRIAKTGSKFYIENAYELLDEAGEFYYNAGEGMIYYKPYPGENLANCETYVGAVEGLVKVSGGSSTEKVQNITFENLMFRYGAYDFISKYGYCGTQSDALSSGFVSEDGQIGYFAQFAVDNADNINIEACEFSCLGSAAISMIDSVSNSSINGNIIRDVAGTGIRIGAPSHQRVNDDVEVCRDIDITNNVLRRTSSESFNNTAISIYYEKFINVSNNDIGSVPYTGISAGWGWTESVPYDCTDIIISNNKITDVMQTLEDGGGIYTLGTLKNSKIYGNYLDGHASVVGGMIYNDEGSAYLNVYDNVIMGATNSLQCHYRPGRTREINYYNNYAENLTQNRPETQTNTDENGVTDYEKYYQTIVMEDLKAVGNYPAEVNQIRENAGLTEEYKYLLDKVEDSNGRSIRYMLPGDPVSDEIKISAAEFNSAASTPGMSVVAVPDGSAVYVDNGEHISYSVKIPKAGWYKFLVYGHYENAKPVLTVSGTMTQSVLGTNPGIGDKVDGRWTIGRFYFEEGEQEIVLTASTNPNGENGLYVIKELIVKNVEHKILPDATNFVEVHDYYTSNVRTQYEEDHQWNYYSSSEEYLVQGPVIADSSTTRKVTYKMHIEEAGDYRIELATTSSVEGDFRVYYQYKWFGTTPDVLATASTKTGNHSIAVFESVKLPAGDIELTLDCLPRTKGNIFMYYFTMKKN